MNAPTFTRQDPEAQALAAYREISAGRKPSVDLAILPLDAVISAALAHARELPPYRGSLDGLADSIAEANAYRLNQEPS